MPWPGPPWMTALEHFIWVGQMEMQFGYLVVYGTVKPPEDAAIPTEWQAATALMEQLEEALDVLDQAGMDLAQFPDIQIKNDGGGVEMQVRLKICDYA